MSGDFNELLKPLREAPVLRGRSQPHRIDGVLPAVAGAIRLIAEKALELGTPSGESPGKTAPVRSTGVLQPQAFLAFDIERVSRRAAVGWLRLPASLRDKLVAGMTNSDAVDTATLLGEAFDLLQGLAGLSVGILRLDRKTARMVRVQEKMALEVSVIRSRVDALHIRLDEQTLRGARTGLHHLLAAANSDVEEARKQRLHMASSEFSALAELDEHGVTEGSSGRVENKCLIILGHWGNSVYFQLLGDSRSALLSVYSAVQRFPRYGVTFFEREYFSRDYKAAVESLEMQLSTADAELEKRKRANLWVGALTGTFRVGRAASAVAAGAAVGFVGAAVGSAIGGPLGVLGAALGVKVHEEVMKVKVPLPDEQPTMELEAQVARMNAEIAALSESIKRECAARIKVMQLLSLDDLRAMR